MEDSAHTPGSRAITIPLLRGKHKDTTLPTHRRSTRDEPMQRTDSTEGSDASESTASSSRTREGLLHTQKTVASPANLYNSSSTPEQPNQRKDKQRAQDTKTTPPNSVPSRALNTYLTHASPLSPSMLSSSSYKSINLTSRTSGDSDEPARIITYTKHSQGFTWNDELFLPSYLIGRRYGGRGGIRRRRWEDHDDDDDEMDGVGDFDEDVDRCPVTDIFVTDEEAAALIPWFTRVWLENGSWLLVWNRLRLDVLSHELEVLIWITVRGTRGHIYTLRKEE